MIVAIYAEVNGEPRLVKQITNRIQSGERTVLDEDKLDLELEKAIATYGLAWIESISRRPQ